MKQRHPEVTHQCKNCGREYVWYPNESVPCSYPPTKGAEICGGKVERIEQSETEGVNNF